MNMNIWLDDEKISSHPLQLNFTVSDIKKEINNWLTIHEVTSYNIKMYINEKEIDPVVLSWINYDNYELPISSDINIYIRKHIQTMNIQTMNIDVLLLLIKKLPGSSVLSLCSINNEFHTLCKRHEDKIYTMLLRRDYPGEQHEGVVGTIKEFYKYLLDEYGATYVSDVYYDENNYPHLGDYLRVPEIDEISNRYKLYDNLAIFNIYKFINPNLSVGQKYWCFAYSKSGKYGEGISFDITDVRKTKEELFEYNAYIPKNMNDGYKVEHYGYLIKVYEIKEMSII